MSIDVPKVQKGMHIITIIVFSLFYYHIKAKRSGQNHLFLGVVMSTYP